MQSVPVWLQTAVLVLTATGLILRVLLAPVLRAIRQLYETRDALLDLRTQALNHDKRISRLERWRDNHIERHKVPTPAPEGAP